MGWTMSSRHSDGTTAAPILSVVSIRARRPCALLLQCGARRHTHCPGNPKQQTVARSLTLPMPAQLGKPLKGAATEQAGGAQGRRRGAGASAADQAERARLEAQAKADLARRLAAATRKQMKVRGRSVPFRAVAFPRSLLRRTSSIASGR